jgi:hypothetical protein
MSKSVKKIFGGWLGLVCVFFTGASAGALGYALWGMLADGYGLDVERHQPMFTNESGYQFGSEGQHRISERFIAILPNLVPLADEFGRAAYQADPDQRRGRMDIGGTDDGERCQRLIQRWPRLQFERIADANRDLSRLIAQRHQFQYPCKRIITALRYRQLYTFQNQFISLMRFSCLSMHWIGTSATLFSSISCPRPVVLRQLASRALGSAPADLPLSRWRDRPRVRTDSSWYSEENVKKILDTQAVTKLLVWTFKGNRLSHADRKVIGDELQMKLTGKLTAPAQRSAKQRSPANGGLPKTKGASA